MEKTIYSCASDTSSQDALTYRLVMLGATRYTSVTIHNKLYKNLSVLKVQIHLFMVSEAVCDSFACVLCARSSGVVNS